VAPERGSQREEGEDGYDDEDFEEERRLRREEWERDGGDRRGGGGGEMEGRLGGFDEDEWGGADGSQGIVYKGRGAMKYREKRRW
jgi:hypothetical protein